MEHRELGRGSEAGPGREQCREVMCEVLGRASQTDTGGAGGGQSSLSARVCGEMKCGAPSF